MKRAWLLLLCLSVPRPAAAHAFAPSLWSLRELTTGSFSAQFKASPDDLDASAPTISGCLVSDAKLDCQAGLGGAEVVLDETARAEVVMVIRWLDGRELTSVLMPGEPSLVLPQPASSQGVPWRFGTLGIVHILTGLDHLLFLLGLIMLVGARRALVGVLSAFTVGHSLTLGLAVSGLCRLPAPPIEALIALSLVLVGVELVRPTDGLARRRPYLVALGFGLVHGLGFASALTLLSLPHGQVMLALAAFNVGVELGQLAFVMALLGIWLFARRLFDTQRWRALPAYAVGAVGAMLFLDRLLAFTAVQR